MSYETGTVVEYETGAETHEQRGRCACVTPHSLGFEPSEAALVITETNAQWPLWLAADLAGNSATLLILQQNAESRAELVARACVRAVQLSDPITNVVWVGSDLDGAFGEHLCEQLRRAVAVDCVVQLTCPDGLISVRVDGAATGPSSTVRALRSCTQSEVCPRAVPLESELSDWNQESA